ncbi:MAG: helix-turn-helix transcriptional regulator [Clostridiales bacterium]|nr:helix-turn-helix transcriptional regulator [Clostridiales bacterium]
MPLRVKKKINIANLWIIVIFTMIAITLVALFMTVYSSILKEEMHYSLREQATVQADTADIRIVDAIENQAVQRISSDDSSAAYIASIAAAELPSFREAYSLYENLLKVNSAFSQAERIAIYFPKSGIMLGTRGARFLNSKKYLDQQTDYDFLRDISLSSTSWFRQIITEDNVVTPYILYIRPYPGIYADGNQPLLILSIKETSFHARLRQTLPTMGINDSVFLIDPDRIIWTAEDTSLIGTQLPVVSSAFEPCTLANGMEIVYTVTISSCGEWSYVLAHPSDGRFTGYDNIFSIWGLVCLGLLITGLILVLRVIMKHYARPMDRLLQDFSIPQGNGDNKRLSSPGEHFLQIETALSDMNKLRQEQKAFLEENQPLLRDSWLNCFIRGEAHYLSPLPQLGIHFPHPYFQVVIAQPSVTEEEKQFILSAFDSDAWQVVFFESRAKESVFLFNHAFDEKTLPQKLESLSDELKLMNSQLVFGVGILATNEDLTPASFRCARRALSARYFETDQRVSLFDPHMPHAEAESAIPQIFSQLTELGGLISHQPQEKVDQAIDSIVNQLKESTPYPNVMRSIMLLAAMYLTKVVYDMKGQPEAVYEDNLLNAYYHIEGISEFSQRLKQDSARLGQFLSRENSASNRSVVQYAIHHIRNTPPAELSTQSIADALSISTGHLSRMFHQETGRKLVDYLQEVRMEHAVRLLSEGQLSNEEICEKIGYSRLQYFSSKFKEHYGLTLNEYRRKSHYDQNMPASSEN